MDPTATLAARAHELLRRFLVHAGRPDAAALDRAVAFRGADPTQSQEELDRLAQARARIETFGVESG